VFNFKSEGRDFSRNDRCLIPADGFYEFTTPADPAKKRKDKHLFTLAGEPWFWIAGIVKEGAFTMLTTAPGPDVAPIHDRQIVVLPIARGLDWLDYSADVLRPLPAGSLKREQVA
jgi:putative SOS response-associated peptidase YedK